MLKQVHGYPNYEVEESGKVWNKKTQKWLIESTTFNGYKTVSMTNSGRDGYKRVKVHRIVAKTFIENPYNYATVNHKDGNKLNNSIDNLEWCTHQQNIIHSWGIGLREKSALAAKNSIKKAHEKTKKPVLQYDFNGNFIKEYPSACEGARALGMSHSNLIHCINKRKSKMAMGFRWEYKENNNN